ncbi:MAG TPA: hypothetical protein VGF61_23400 [Candidatus Acidoferrum sp.]|jgi:hypothetical protein
MRSLTRIALSELLLIFPAALFMTALVVRNLPPQCQLALTAQRIVMWYAGRTWTLWALLLALPFAVLVTGCATLLRGWDRDLQPPNIAHRSLALFRAHPASLFLAATTVVAAAILVIVVVHMLAN